MSNGIATSYTETEYSRVLATHRGLLTKPGEYTRGGGKLESKKRKLFYLLPVQN